MGFYLMDFTIQQSTKFSVFIMYFVFQKNPKLLGKLFSLFRKTYLRETLRPLRNAIFSFLSIPAWHRLKRSKAIKLDLGSGAKRGSNGWTTVDITGADISHDLRKKSRYRIILYPKFIPLTFWNTFPFINKENFCKNAGEY